MTDDVTNSACSTTCLQPRGHRGACDVDYESLGRRAVACSGWRWMAGMLTLGVTTPDYIYPPYRFTDRPPSPRVGVLPDLGDPATLGCLLALAREAWDGAVVGEMTDYSESYDDKGGRLEMRVGRVVLFRSTGGTRAERLIAALEASSGD